MGEWTFSTAPQYVLGHLHDKIGEIMTSATDRNVTIAEAYYQAMERKEISALEQYLHPDVEFIAPLAKTQGKEALIEGAKNFASFFNTLTIHAKFGDDDKAVIVYDLDCPMPVGSFRAVALMSFEDELISRVELFYDARPFEK